MGVEVPGRSGTQQLADTLTVLKASSLASLSKRLDHMLNTLDDKMGTDSRVLGVHIPFAPLQL